MSVRCLKVGLIGFGRMGINHLKAINSSKLGEVVAIADPVVEASKIAETVGKSIHVFKNDAYPYIGFENREIIKDMAKLNATFGSDYSFYSDEKYL